MIWSLPRLILITAVIWSALKTIKLLCWPFRVLHKKCAHFDQCNIYLYPYRRTLLSISFENCVSAFVIPRASTKLKGGYTGITLSICPSVDRIVSPLYLQQYSLDPFSYLHILSSNFRRCVACNARFKIWNFGKFFKFVTLTLSSFDLGSNMTQWYG